MDGMGLARAFQSVPIPFPHTEPALQVFRLRDASAGFLQVLPIKAPLRVTPHGWPHSCSWSTAHLHACACAIAAHTQSTQKSMCSRTYLVLVARALWEHFSDCCFFSENKHSLLYPCCSSEKIKSTQAFLLPGTMHTILLCSSLP